MRYKIIPFLFFDRIQRSLLHAGYRAEQPCAGPRGRHERRGFLGRRVQGAQQGEGADEVLPELQEATGQDRSRPDPGPLHPHDQRQAEDTQPGVDREVQIVSDDDR